MGRPYSEPFRAVHPLFAGPLVLQLNRRKEEIPPLVVRRYVFAEEEEVGGQAAGRENVEPGEEVDGGVG